MKDKKILNLYPAEKWEDATPLGNGKLGCSVYGYLYDERILINHEELYNACYNNPLPDISSELSAVRDLLDKKQYKKANDYYTDILRQKGFWSHKGSFYPAFDLHCLIDTDFAFTNYTRILDMEKGVSYITYFEKGNKVLREVFVSKKYNAVIFHIEKKLPFGMEFSLEEHDPADKLSEGGDTVNPKNAFSSVSNGEYIYSKCTTEQGLSYCGIAKILETDGKITKNSAKELKIDMSGSGKLRNSVRVEGATYITLAITVQNNIAEFEELKSKSDEIKAPYNEIKQTHIRTFSKIFRSARINLCSDKNTVSNEQLLLDAYRVDVPEQLIEKMADYGRYLLISSSYACSLPANLQGVWNGAYHPAWCCTFFNNENVQMCYWQAFKGNLSDTVLPLFNLYERFMDDYRHNAKNLFGCRGILLPLFMDNSNGKKDNLQPHVLYWTGSSAWIASIYFDYYLYTNDEKFLKEHAYPFMYEAALFYRDFMVKDGMGTLKSYPSNSPENRADGNFGGAKELSVSINATMDFALVKELLTNLIYISDNFGIGKENKCIWSDMLSSIPNYEINEDGAIKEWMHPDFKDNYHHRHLSHIYPLFPGSEITEQSDKTMFEAMKTAVEKRLVIGLKEQTGWSFAHMANIFARLGNAEKSKECLCNIIRFCTGKNLFTYHNDWRNMGVTLKYTVARKAPFQIDANMGFTSAVYEMLLYSNMNMIKILPALPESFKKGNAKGLISKGGHKTDISWDRSGIKVKIKAGKDASLNIGASNCKSISSDIDFEKSEYGDNFALVKLKKGKTYSFFFAK